MLFRRVRLSVRGEQGAEVSGVSRPFLFTNLTNAYRTHFDESEDHDRCI